MPPPALKPKPLLPLRKFIVEVPNACSEIAALREYAAGLRGPDSDFRPYIAKAYGPYIFEFENEAAANAFRTHVYLFC